MKPLDFNIFEAQQTHLTPLKGRILIAEPFLQGLYFKRSIILLTEYSENGAVGFVLNKPMDYYPDEVIEDLFSFKGELHLGGPVATDTLYYIHTLGDKIPNSVQITDTLYWGGDFEYLKELINKDEATYRDVKFFAGYSGWSAGQLESEIEEKSWIVSTTQIEDFINLNHSDMWKKAMEELGSQFKSWINFPENPKFN